MKSPTTGKTDSSIRTGLAADDIKQAFLDNLRCASRPSANGRHPA